MAELLDLGVLGVFSPLVTGKLTKTQNLVNFLRRWSGIGGEHHTLENLFSLTLCSSFLSWRSLSQRWHQAQEVKEGKLSLSTPPRRLLVSKRPPPRRRLALLSSKLLSSKRLASSCCCRGSCLAESLLFQAAVSEVAFLKVSSSKLLSLKLPF